MLFFHWMKHVIVLPSKILSLVFLHQLAVSSYHINRFPFVFCFFFILSVCSVSCSGLEKAQRALCVFDFSSWWAFWEQDCNFSAYLPKVMRINKSIFCGILTMLWLLTGGFTSCMSSKKIPQKHPSVRFFLWMHPVF